MIREGAILVDHPEQVIEDLALPTQWQYQQNQIASSQNLTTAASTKAKLSTPPTEAILQTTTTKTADTSTPHIPEHLLALYQQLDWVGQSIDHLAQTTEFRYCHTHQRINGTGTHGLLFTTIRFISALSSTQIRFTISAYFTFLFR